MLTFDKLKLVSSLESITILDESAFNVMADNDRILSLLYHQKKPFLLSIKIDYENHESTIEFTGKILGSDYPKLISWETIRQCFENINQIGICQIDIDAMMYSKVVTCDVTQDIIWDDTYKLAKYIKGHLINYQKYKCHLNKNGNLTIESNVITRKFKKRLIIYDKEKEMSRVGNKDFSDEYGLNGKFDNVCRFELNLNSVKQIKETLRIRDNDLNSVLRSDATPILSFIEETVIPPSEIEVGDEMKDYINMLVLRDCNYDLEQVEGKLRMYYNRASVCRKMKEYRTALDAMTRDQHETTYSMLMEKLRGEEAGENNDEVELDPDNEPK